MLPDLLSNHFLVKERASNKEPFKYLKKHFSIYGDTKLEIYGDYWGASTPTNISKNKNIKLYPSFWSGSVQTLCCRGLGGLQTLFSVTFKIKTKTNQTGFCNPNPPTLP